MTVFIGVTYVVVIDRHMNIERYVLGTKDKGRLFLFYHVDGYTVVNLEQSYGESRNICIQNRCAPITSVTGQSSTGA